MAKMAKKRDGKAMAASAKKPSKRASKRTNGAAKRIKVKYCIIGAGSAGINALRQIRRKTDDVVIIGEEPLGTTCARVGCMPSKVLIQAAEDFHHRHHLKEQGITGGQNLKVDTAAVLAHVRQMRDMFVGRLLGNFLPNVGDKLIKGTAEFISPKVVRVDDLEVEAKTFVLAVGSRPILPQAWAPFADRLYTSDTLFEQKKLPKRLAVIGLGVIGLELGQALARLGHKVTGIDALNTIGGITDPAVRDKAIEVIGADMPIWLGHPAELSQGSKPKSLKIKAGPHEVEVNAALVCLGRRSNLDRLNLSAAGVKLNGDLASLIDEETLQIRGTRLYVAGDATGDRPVMHEVADEGRIAGRNALATRPSKYARKQPFGIIFSDPNICRVGATYQQLEGVLDNVVIGERDFATQSRAQVLKKNYGLLRVYANKNDGLLLGAEMCIPRGEHIAHHLAWAIERDMTVFDVLAMPFYHPVVEEGLQNALFAMVPQITHRPRTCVQVRPKGTKHVRKAAFPFQSPEELPSVS